MHIRTNIKTSQRIGKRYRNACWLACIPSELLSLMFSKLLSNWELRSRCAILLLALWGSESLCKAQRKGVNSYWFVREGSIHDLCIVIDFVASFSVLKSLASLRSCLGVPSNGGRRTYCCVGTCAFWFGTNNRTAQPHHKIVISAGLCFFQQWTKVSFQAPQSLYASLWPMLMVFLRIDTLHNWIMHKKWLLANAVAFVVCGSAFSKPDAPPINSHRGNTDRLARSRNHFAEGGPSSFRPSPPASVHPSRSHTYEDGLLPTAAAKPRPGEFPSDQLHRSESMKLEPPLAARKGPGLPIHYDFPAVRDTTAEDGRPQDFSSARRDKITVYMSSTTGKVKIVSSASLIGGFVSLFLAKVRSITRFHCFRPLHWSFSRLLQSVIPVATNFLCIIGAASFFIGSFFRTPFGELVRALSLSLILVLQRTATVRRLYPTWGYLAASLGRKNKNLRPFPPSPNHWTYEPKRPGDVDFSMLYSVIAMALVGSFCGGNVPLLPTWIGSLTGAALFAFGCTLSNARGDLCRTMGMRIVALVQDLWVIQTDLKIIPKAAVVTGQVIDKLMIFDRKHRVKDRFLALVTKAYDSATQAASQIQDNRTSSRSSPLREDIRN